ncbi:TNF receptor-associated factor 6-like isoform X1 [Oopsacas minuta]|uniref:TNF receptor-associated factor 6-like isoform X1 n=1 Tax=Oopsacas minuta TaxID=111878 RepID=A0AAV7K3Z6_9METZ|nr:TNF receptor-associated factor 6-like isoform X1 [Oopsacas minuta]
MAKKLGYSEGREDLVHIKTEDGSYRGWRVDLLVENFSSKVEEKLLLCCSCRGLLREPCLYQEEVRCGVCIPVGVAWQPVQMNREIVNDKMISCPLKKKGFKWSNTVSTVLRHLEQCEFFPVLCPLGCVSLEGESKGKVVKLERRLIPEHQRDSSPLRELVCEFCLGKVKACEMNPHLEDSNECPLQKVQCPYWDHGYREEMERREFDLHEREFMQIHYKLSITEIKDKLDRATDKIAFLEMKSN